MKEKNSADNDLVIQYVSFYSFIMTLINPALGNHLHHLIRHNLLLFIIKLNRTLYICIKKREMAMDNYTHLNGSVAIHNRPQMITVG